MLSLVLTSLLNFWGNGIESQGGQVWWYHPYDGTFTYQACDVKGNWSLNERSLEISEFSVNCIPPRGWIFEQKFHTLSLERRGMELWNAGRQVGQLLANQSGFAIEIVDKWDDRHHLKYFERSNGTRRIEWFVRSDQYIDFDLRVDEAIPSRAFKDNN